MDEKLNQLNYDFNFQVFMLNNAIKQLNHQDAQNAVAWINKCKKCNQTDVEARLRNDFLFYLTQNCYDGKLLPPFNQKPPPGSLANVLQLMPADAQANFKQNAVLRGDPAKRAEIFDKSPDKGAFLVSQPVPRCGAFCYLAVINRN